MKLAIEDTFALTCEAYEALYFDEPFNIALGDALGLGRELVRFERTADRIVRHVRCEPKQDPDSPVKQAFGTSRASFLEELDYDRRTRKGVWSTVPNLWSQRVTNRGTIEFVSVGPRVKRIVHGEVKVSLFGFGKLVEKMIVAEIEKSYVAAAKFTTAWLETPR